MLGRYVPQLYLLAPEWASGNEEALFGGGATDVLQNPIWAAYLARGGFFDAVFTRLRSWYVRAAETVVERGDVSVGERHWAPSRGLADHVLIAVLHGLAAVGDMDALVEKTFSGVAAAFKKEVYWETYAAWKDAKVPVPIAVVTRLVAFWEWRLTVLEAATKTPQVEMEADGLFQFVSAPYISVTDAVQMGRRNIQLLSADQHGRGDPWEGLGNLAATDAPGAFEIVELLVTAALQGKHAYLPFDQLAPALSAALSCSDRSIQQRAVRLINQLGESGFDDFGALLKAGGK